MLTYSGFPRYGLPVMTTVVRFPSWAHVPKEAKRPVAFIPSPKTGNFVIGTNVPFLPATDDSGFIRRTPDEPKDTSFYCGLNVGKSCRLPALEMVIPRDLRSPLQQLHGLKRRTNSGTAAHKIWRLWNPST